MTNPNRLINESSPYLLQHAYNPVDWYPWGKEALTKSKVEDKPILLSIGYSACHWCHVMAHESFENDQIAELMNLYFVCIKVDREERPDLDSIYMKAIQVTTGSGGWPLTAFLTPDCKPFYGGTYFPPEDRHGIPGFPKLLKSVSDAYINSRSEIDKHSVKLTEHVEKMMNNTGQINKISASTLKVAFDSFYSEFDHEFGGFGTSPKFPQPVNFEFALRYHIRFQDKDSLRVVEESLTHMANGGIYDQIGGGFHRYSTDEKWIVPHFEKMLYDNALLTSLYLHVYETTKNQFYLEIAEDTLSYVKREMLDQNGSFYSSQDADSEGIEGKFFVWNHEEILEHLGEKEGKIFAEYFGVTANGNFEGKSILIKPNYHQNISPENNHELLKSINLSKEKLLKARNTRIPPETDKKIITSWNALMMKAFSEAAITTNNSGYLRIAKSNAEFLTNKLYKSSILYRTYQNGEPKITGFLEDYSFLIDALLKLHEASFESKWIEIAVDLCYEMVNLFWDDSKGTLYDTSTTHETLVIRPSEWTDNAIPAGTSLAVEVLLKFSVILDEQLFNNIATRILGSMTKIVEQFPSASGQWLNAIDFYTSNNPEITIVGSKTNKNTQMLLDEVYKTYIPNKILIGINQENSNISNLAFTKYKQSILNQPTAYLCQNYECDLPTNDPKILYKQLMDIQ